MSKKPDVNRRNFLKTGALAAASAGGVAGTAMSLPANSYAQVGGANNRIRIGFLGVGGRCQQHISVILAMRQADANSVQPVAVCDVWNGDPNLGGGNGRGLNPSATRCGLNLNDQNSVTKDYRRILNRNDVDVVCIATPDHWHAKMSIDAMQAGKHVYCEKPMTKTIAEAQRVVDVWNQTNKVMTVGVQSMADPTWRMAHDRIKTGTYGHVMQAQTSYYRNSLVGQWRYYPLNNTMNPTTIDWPMFLGNNFSVFPGVPLAPQMPFDRAKWAQWRCYWDFGGGMYTDLFVHQTTHMIAAMGVRYPKRVVGGGGIYLEYDGRDVPDVATVVADYNEGCQLIITATMCNSHPLEETIRCRLATLRFKTQNNQFGFEALSQNIGNAPTGPGGQPIGQQAQFIPGGLQGDDTRALWQNFLQCVRANNRNTLSTPDLGAAAFTTVNMGVLSYRQGLALFWDAHERRPVSADASWATQWEQRSHQRGQPNQIIGWTGTNQPAHGSSLNPPAYQRLEGPWNNGQDPAQNNPAGGGN
jgi:predicted dehydrogenase